MRITITGGTGFVGSQGTRKPALSRNEPFLCA